MGTHSSVSQQQLAIRDDSLSIATADCQKAWYLLYILLTIGRPAATLRDLASRCAPFPATPDVVRRLCSFPNSPIALASCGDGDRGTGGVYVTISAVGVSVIGKLVSDSGSIRRFLSWIGLGLGVDLAGGASQMLDGVRMYFNKRKRSGFVGPDMEIEDPVASGPCKRIRTTGFEASFSAVDGGSCWDARCRSKLMEIMLNGGISIPGCFSRTVVSRLDYRLNDIKQIEGERILTSISDGKEQKIVTAHADIPEESGLEILKFDDYGFELDVEIGELEFRANGIGETIIPAECQGAYDFLETTSQLVAEIFESIHNDEVEFGTCRTEVGTSYIALKTGFGGVSMETECNLRKVQAFSNKGSAPDVAQLDQVELHTGINDDAVICLGEVGGSITIPVESIRNFEVGILAEVDRGQIKPESEASNVTVEKKVHASSSKEAVPDVAQLDKVEFQTGINDDAVIFLGEVDGSITIPVESMHNVEVGILAEVDQVRIQPESETSNVTVEKKVQACSNHGTAPIDANNQNGLMTPEFSITEECKLLLPKTSAKTRIASRGVISSRHQSLLRKSSDGIKPESPVKGKKQQGNDQVETCILRSSKQKQDDVQTREARKDVAVVSSQDQFEARDLPYFESYTVEEEEGSGGYGTVYRARKKDDGSTVAIKYPHANARKQHVINEQRMLERFGGKNYIIRYKETLKSGNSDCFVLEHVDHDRPEALRREIDLVQLRWYGFCLFRALSSLHKQGIVHRDVKPGNFLFSRKTNKGYLIDFNLALDLHQKHGTSNKFREGNDKNSSDAMLQKARSSYQPVKSTRVVQHAESLDIRSREESKVSKRALETNNCKRKAGNNSSLKVITQQSQGAEGSGITSTRTPSAERLREHFPSHGSIRKEILNLLQENLKSPNHNEASIAPTTSMRKRVAAAPPSTRSNTLPRIESKRKNLVDAGLVYITPMPLQPSAMALAVGGLTKCKDGKMKNEGPCMGTKGFRAPEVLLRSQYQGPKVDTWSAGVTLLYLIIGRSPFYGEPEENIREIAKLRGSEDLWEVAKLHDRESSFPQDLYSTKSLPSVSLREWCRINTKRRDFFDRMPASLLDLVDRCLTVNPRSRISSEEALKHEFFAPLYEIKKKQQLIRQGTDTDPADLCFMGRSLGGPLTNITNQLAA